MHTNLILASLFYACPCDLLEMSLLNNNIIFKCPVCDVIVCLSVLVFRIILFVVEINSWRFLVGNPLQPVNQNFREILKF